MNVIPAEALNVIGTPLKLCGTDPLTGWHRDGCCNTDPNDSGLHTVCAVVTQDFLDFSRAVGNDLSTPVPAFGFPGLKPGDHWCLCAARWEEARRAGFAPDIILQASHEKTLEITLLGHLQAHAVD